MADRFVRPPRQPVAVGTADRKRRPVISGEFRKSADLGRFNLWRPMVVARTRGSKWPSALPTVTLRSTILEPADQEES